MKMISQLTRQAMSRHRLLSSCAASAFPPAPPLFVVQPTGFHSPELITKPVFEKTPSASIPGRIQSLSSGSACLPNRRTVYQQLMSSHDRMTERHLKHT